MVDACAHTHCKNTIMAVLPLFYFPQPVCIACVLKSSRFPQFSGGRYLSEQHTDYMRVACGFNGVLGVLIDVCFKSFTIH